MELYVKVFMASYTDQTTCSYQFNIVFYHMLNIQCHCELNVNNPFAYMFHLANLIVQGLKRHWRIQLIGKLDSTLLLIVLKVENI